MDSGKAINPQCPFRTGPLSVSREWLSRMGSGIGLIQVRPPRGATSLRDHPQSGPAETVGHYRSGYK